MTESDPANTFTLSLRGAALSRELSVARPGNPVFDFNLQYESEIKETMDCHATLTMMTALCAIQHFPNSL